MKHLMEWGGLRSPIALLAAVPLMVGGAAARGSERQPVLDPVGFLIRTNYHGWTNSILVSNGRVEAVIVPAIGRVVQFRLAGAEDGPFWENRALGGTKPEPG